ncbi:hypothetical protein J2Y73_001604 [Peribacillus frigoritolerans]|jgi:hypothetical protein|nr:hypothetical protein [Peribacillus frigoritolerans]PCD07915.1 hypothetical protein CMV16_11535 [Peribacillus simplex]
MKFNKWSLDIFKGMIYTRKKREKDYLKKGFEVQKKVFNIVESSKDIIYCYESNRIQSKFQVQVSKSIHQYTFRPMRLGRSLQWPFPPFRKDSS